MKVSELINALQQLNCQDHEVEIQVGGDGAIHGTRRFDVRVVDDEHVVLDG